MIDRDIPDHPDIASALLTGYPVEYDEEPEIDYDRAYQERMDRLMEERY